MDQHAVYWSSNIKFLRKRKNLTQLQLASLLGFTRTKISAHEGGKTKNPRLEDIVAVSKSFNISIDHLLLTDLSALPAEEVFKIETATTIDISGQKIRVLPITVNDANEENMEFVPAKAKAGYRTGFSDPEFITNLPKFSLPGLPKDKTIRMFPVSGDSMLPIPDGSHVIGQYVDDWLHLKNNTACILVLKGGEEDIIFKLVENRVKKDGTLVLSSLNELYEPYAVNVHEVLEIWKFIGYVSREMPALSA
ncbi:helix-turn-helix protein [Chitinophaga skermanii]|uniref:Helix-turn-helix protein n=1 Tax=Chitinophaga skermanii TaxID=331697 RepID=A0A327QPK9_9BACT|nr:LexA family transcriptional regulator [Chitinophaga skermanii]RAJ06566.1 helix-turn-helix protein [Chitinophaga skermanii]